MEVCVCVGAGQMIHLCCHEGGLEWFPGTAMFDKCEIVSG